MDPLGVNPTNPAAPGPGNGVPAQPVPDTTTLDPALEALRNSGAPPAGPLPQMRPADGQNQDPEAPSPLTQLIFSIVKYVVPILLGIGALVMIGSAIASSAPLIAPFVALTGGVLLLGVGMCAFISVFTTDYQKDMQIRNLNSELENAKKEKPSLSSLETLKREVKGLEEQVKKKSSRQDELIALQKVQPHSKEQRKESEQLIEEQKKLEKELAIKRKCISKLEEK